MADSARQKRTRSPEQRVSLLVRTSAAALHWIDARAAVSGMSRNAFAIHCMTRDDPPAVRRQALPPDPEERACLKKLLFELLLLRRTLSRLVRSPPERHTAASTDREIRILVDRLGHVVDEIAGRL